MNDLKERVEKYIEIEKNAFDKLKIGVPPGSYLEGSARDFLFMAKSYYNDAIFFKKKGDLVNALAALNYSYGWIDAGVRIGLLDGGDDHRLFTHFK